MRVYSANRGQPEALRKAEFLEAFARDMPVAVQPGAPFAGSQAFCGVPWKAYFTEAECECMAFGGNLGHIIVDYGRILRDGCAGTAARLDRMQAGSAVNREAMQRAWEAFRLFVRRHGPAARALGASPWGGGAGDDACARLADNPASTFREALQLLWLAHVFLHAEGMAAAISFGRFDQYMWPLLRADLAEQRLSVAEAQTLLSAFWIQCCEGDESQNLTVGGVDAEGHAADNPLTVMCLDAAREAGVWQPSMSLRAHAETPEAVWEAALRLCASGSGMPSFFNDGVVIRGLKAAGIPDRRARDWGVVGCYEATPQGDTYGATVGGSFVLPERLNAFLAEGRKETRFEAFYAAFKERLKRDYSAALADCQRTWDAWRIRCASPFESVCTTGCMESGLLVEEGGASYNLFGINILGLGTVVDSLWAIRSVVYERHETDICELAGRLADRRDARLHAMCRHLAGKYGTDAPGTNALAADLSKGLAETVLDSRMERNVRPYPGFFRFSADVHLRVGATPDGRHAGESLSYGAGPSVLCGATTPTRAANSAAAVCHDRCACGNPLLLSMARAELSGASGRRRLRDVVTGYFRMGGFHVHVNAVGAEELRAAQSDPDSHPDLLVRVSGYSARFTALDRRWQDVLIERTQRGL